jgi:uncharacterized membrane protein YtjA (UPF0391 family)
MMGIWGCKGWFDRELSRRIGGPARVRLDQFRSLISRNFEGFLRREQPGTFVPASDYFCNSRDAPGRADVETESEAKDRVMIGWVVTFLIVALIAGILGFGGVAGASIEMAKIIFFIAVVLFLISAVVGLVRGRTHV